MGENDIKKGHTEIKALRVMIQSYTQIPTFGDAKTFQEELDSTILKVQKLEADLHSLNLIVKEFDNQLEERKSNQKQAPLPGPKLSGELFIREGEDEDGWTKVRRKNITENRCQGFVPSSYITLVKSNHN